jgi:putative DNA primase/helicase
MLPDNAGALRRRLLAIKTPTSFVGREDVDLDDKLAAELPAFVNLALSAYRRLVDRGSFVQPESGEELLGLMRQNSSYLANFVEECCEVGPDLVESKAALYEKWRLWCSAKGHSPSADNKFASDLYTLDLGDGHRIVQSKRTLDGKRVPCYQGLTLKSVDKKTKWSDCD